MDVENLSSLSFNGQMTYSAVARQYTAQGAGKSEEGKAPKESDPIKTESADKAEQSMTDASEEDDAKFAESVREAVEKINKTSHLVSRKLTYRVHDKTHKVMVSVINSDTDEIIREIPPKSVLDSYAKMLELAGLIVDEQG